MTLGKKLSGSSEDSHVFRTIVSGGLRLLSPPTGSRGDPVTNCKKFPLLLRVVGRKNFKEELDWPRVHRVSVIHMAAVNERLKIPLRIAGSTKELVHLLRVEQTELSQGQDRFESLSERLHLFGHALHKSPVAQEIQVLFNVFLNKRQLDFATHE